MTLLQLSSLLLLLEQLLMIRWRLDLCPSLILFFEESLLISNHLWNATLKNISLNNIHYGFKANLADHFKAFFRLSRIFEEYQTTNFNCSCITNDTKILLKHTIDGRQCLPNQSGEELWNWVNDCWKINQELQGWNSTTWFPPMKLSFRGQK